MSHLHRSRIHESERGAAALEFSLIAIILFTLIFAIIEFGLFFSRYQVFSSAAREGARVASTRGTESGIRERIVEAAVPFGSAIPSAGISTVVYDDDGAAVGSVCTEETPGNRIVVEWSQDFTDAIVIPFVPNIDITRTIRGVFRCE